MKYGETVFDIAYLIIAFAMGIICLLRAKNKVNNLMGAAILILGAGDAFHLVPRVLNYFLNADFTSWLGIGKLVTSLPMTVFYILLYYIYIGYFNVKENKAITTALYVLSAVRAIFCAMPQNGWLQNEASFSMAVLRNIPFIAIGIIIVILYLKESKKGDSLRFVWLLVTLSFLFYIPVALFAGFLPVLGALMLPKTICYIIIIFIFTNTIRKTAA